MDVIRITPEELREMARGFRRAAKSQYQCASMAHDSEDREAFARAGDRAGQHRLKLDALADYLVGSRIDVLEFVPRKGVQS